MYWLQLAGVSFAALFPLVNPVGAVPLFATLTQQDTAAFRKEQALKTAIWVVVILAAFEYLGHFILVFFGISLGMLQIAGGLIVGHTGWQMSTGASRVSSNERRHGHPSLREVRASAAALGHQVVDLPKRRHNSETPAGTGEEAGTGAAEDRAEAGSNAAASAGQPEHQGPDISFSPMAMPMLAGPGAIGVVIGLTSHTRNGGGPLDTVGILIGIALIGVLTLICLRATTPIIKALGDNGILAMQRIMGFLVLAISVALISYGISALFGVTLYGTT